MPNPRLPTCPRRRRRWRAISCMAPTIDIPPHISSQTIGPLTFDACFDSGNCAQVTQTNRDEFSIWTNPDAMGTDFVKQYKVWFHFAVRGVARGRLLTFVVYNMNNLGKLFRHDMRPVYRVLPSKPRWSRLPLPTTQTGTEKGSECFVLTFKHRFEGSPDDTLYFAFCYPLSYTDNIARLAYLDHLFGLQPAAIRMPGATPRPAGGFGAAAVERKTAGAPTGAPTGAAPAPAADAGAPSADAPSAQPPAAAAAVTATTNKSLTAKHILGQADAVPPPSAAPPTAAKASPAPSAPVVVVPAAATPSAAAMASVHAAALAAASTLGRGNKSLLLGRSPCTSLGHVASPPSLCCWWPLLVTLLGGLAW